MIKKFNEEEYQQAKGSEYLLFECEKCGKDFKKQKRFLKAYMKGNQKCTIRYCSKECKNEGSRINIIKTECSNCSNQIEVKPHMLRKSKSGRSFCNKSCAAKFNNRNKVTGNRRSKLEIWIEIELTKKYKHINIIYNGKSEINSELDIYIPSLNLAFELNGIFHYEPIYGKEKLKNILNNDNRKFQACLEKNIELCVIDTTGSKVFKPERDRIYLNIIENIIDTKLEI